MLCYPGPVPAASGKEGWVESSHQGALLNAEGHHLPWQKELWPISDFSFRGKASQGLLFPCGHVFLKALDSAKRFHKLITITTLCKVLFLFVFPVKKCKIPPNK